MTPERFQQVRKLFAAALEREPAARGSYLQQACQRDEELLGEVETNTMPRESGCMTIQTA